MHLIEEVKPAGVLEGPGMHGQKCWKALWKKAVLDLLLEGCNMWMCELVAVRAPGFAVHLFLHFNTG